MPHLRRPAAHPGGPKVTGNTDLMTRVGRRVPKVHAIIRPATELRPVGATLGIGSRDQKCRLSSATCASTSWIPCLPSTTPPGPPSCRWTPASFASSGKTPITSASPRRTACWPASWSACRQDAPHDSPNFLWFRERYPEFLYIDRIVVASRRRGAGVGRVFYADVQSYAEVRVPQLAGEVFLESSSHPALLFHGSFGFREVGQHVMPGTRPARRDADQGTVQLSRGSTRPTARTLPDQPWLAARTMPGRTPAPARPAPEHGGHLPGLRTGRRTEDRPGRHRQPAHPHARRRASLPRKCAIACAARRSCSRARRSSWISAACATCPDAGDRHAR